MLLQDAPRLQVSPLADIFAVIGSLQFVPPNARCQPRLPLVLAVIVQRILVVEKGPANSNFFDLVNRQRFGRDVDPSSYLEGSRENLIIDRSIQIYQ